MLVRGTVPFSTPRAEGGSGTSLLKSFKFRWSYPLIGLFREIIPIKIEILGQVHRPRKYKPCQKLVKICEEGTKTVIKPLSLYQLINLKILHSNCRMLSSRRPKGSWEFLSKSESIDPPSVLRIKKLEYMSSEKFSVFSLDVF